MYNKAKEVKIHRKILNKDNVIVSYFKSPSKKMLAKCITKKTALRMGDWNLKYTSVRFLYFM
jgi:hypothetical protein